MKGQPKFPELTDAIAAHARSLVGGNLSAAEAWVAGTAREAHRALAADIHRKGALTKHQELALAKIGMQFMSKIRFEGPGGPAVLLTRWTCEAGGKWRIVECDDITAMRSPWSEIPPLSEARSKDSDA